MLFRFVQIKQVEKSTHVYCGMNPVKHLDKTRSRIMPMYTLTSHVWVCVCVQYFKSTEKTFGNVGNNCI